MMHQTISQNPKDALRRLSKALLTAADSDPQAEIDNFSFACRGVSADAICKACSDYVDGVVPGQSLKYMPTAPEFATYARRCDEMLASLRSHADRAKLPPPRPVKRQTPFDRNMQKIAAEMRGWTVIAQNVAHSDFAKGCKSNAYPNGANWRSDGKVYSKHQEAQS